MLGRRATDIALVVDFGELRGIVRANTAWMPSGIALEIIPSGVNNYAPGMVLLNDEWEEVYFLIERSGWIDQEYFDYAEKRFRELNIKNP